MTSATLAPRRAEHAAKETSFVYHDSFAGPDAERLYGRDVAIEEPLSFLPDEVTRDCARRMHYASWRAATAALPKDAARWRRRYYELRDRVVLGNRKLAYRAVRKWAPPAQLADDMAAECQVVLIQAVAAFNPWLGVRFSTYAFTCLMRALSRLSQRQAADRLARAVPLESLPAREPAPAAAEAAPGLGAPRLEEFFREGHELLTPREKSVLVRRYRLEDGGAKAATLEEVGRGLGLSKERVRQVQMSALAKLREALLAAPPS